MEACPQCGKQSIRRSAKFWMLLYGRPSCGECGTPITLSTAAMLSMSASVLVAFFVGAIASTKLYRWLVEPVNVAAGIVLGLAVVAAAAVLAVRFAPLRIFPADERQRLVRASWVAYFATVGGVAVCWMVFIGPPSTPAGWVTLIATAMVLALVSFLTY